MSHLDFLNQCITQGVTPRGLTVNVSCNALLAHYSDVEAQFFATKSQAEAYYVRALKAHYESAKVKLDDMVRHNAEVMEVVVAGSSEGALREHDNYNQKTTVWKKNG